MGGVLDYFKAKNMRFPSYTKQEYFSLYDFAFLIVKQILLMNIRVCGKFTRG